MLLRCKIYSLKLQHSHLFFLCLLVMRYDAVKLRHNLWRIWRSVPPPTTPTRIKIFLLLSTLLAQGNIFRSVCQEFCSQGGGLPHCMLGYTPPPRNQRQAPRDQWQTPRPPEPDTPSRPVAGTPPGPEAGTPAPE